MSNSVLAGKATRVMALVAIVGFGTSSSVLASNCGEVTPTSGAWYTAFSCGDTNGATYDAAACGHIDGLYTNCCATTNSVTGNGANADNACVKAFCSQTTLQSVSGSSNCQG